MSRLVPDKAVEIVKEFEALRQYAYQDSAGVWTIGYGHTGNVKAGDYVNKSEATRLLRHDLRTAAAAVDGGLKRPVTDRQRAALISITFNIGIYGFLQSTLLKRVNRKVRRKKRITEAFLMWNKATVNGQLVVLQGLTNRRRAEAALFFKKP